MTTDTEFKMSDLYYRIPLSVIRMMHREGEDVRDMIETLADGDDWYGDNWRVIHDEALLDTLIEELESDTYILGCFNAWFIAEHTNLNEGMVKACQDTGECEAIGQAILDGDYLDGPHGMAAAYAAADGWGHHFAHYDFEDHELAGNWHAFKTN